MVSFINSQSQFLNLPDGTVPFNNSPYSVFLVSKTYSLGNFGVLGSGTYLTNYYANSFRYSGSADFVNYWWSNDIYSNTGVIKVNQLQIITTTYDLSNRKMYVNGQLSKTTASSNRASTRINNTIGKTYNTEYMNGEIAEIIIYERSLSDNERSEIESYLSKKWSIKIN